MCSFCCSLRCVMVMTSHSPALRLANILSNYRQLLTHWFANIDEYLMTAEYTNTSRKSRPETNISDTVMQWTEMRERNCLLYTTFLLTINLLTPALYVLSCTVKMTNVYYTYEITISCAWNYLISDIDECRTGEHSCQQLCTNLPGTYNCSCSTGFMLNNDSITCSGRNLGRVIHFDFVSKKLLMV